MIDMISTMEVKQNEIGVNKGRQRFTKGAR